MQSMTIDNRPISEGRCPILNDTAYTWASGTSMAVPHVAGLAAIYLGKYPYASPSDIKSQILRSGTSGSIQFYAQGAYEVLPGTPNLIVNTIASLGGYVVTASGGP